ncbi:hypothetical protein BGZ76_006960 [Entomortierella beljakovae]|nr:hypothetical protein BGZ76_006960 [Entomortierella beljakovae]
MASRSSSQSSSTTAAEEPFGHIDSQGLLTSDDGIIGHSLSKKNEPLQQSDKTSNNTEQIVSLPVSIKVDPKRPIFTIESPEVSTWDVLKNPVPQFILEKIPLEIWSIILCHTPPTRLVRLTLVSKAWRLMINQLPLWKDVISQCNITNLKPNSGKSLMAHVLDHMVVICDLCLGGCDKFGADLPLPVRRADIFGLIWMCKGCRDFYRLSHSSIMDQLDRAPKDEDVYEQGPCQKVNRQRRHYYPRCGYHRNYGFSNRHCYYGSDDSDEYEDEFEDEYESDESEYDNFENYVVFQPSWKNKANTTSWLNLALSRGRSRLLNAVLGVYGLKVRSDSRLCSDFINGTKYCPLKIVDVMREMAWYFDYTCYSEYIRHHGMRSKALAIAVWTQNVYHEYESHSLDVYKTLEDAPPDSLWGRIEPAFKRHEHYGKEKARLKRERVAERQSKIQSKLENESAAQGEATAVHIQDSSDYDLNEGDSDHELDEDYDDSDPDENEFHEYSDSSIINSVCDDLMAEFSFEVDCEIKP